MSPSEPALYQPKGTSTPLKTDELPSVEPLKGSSSLYDHSISENWLRTEAQLFHQAAPAKLVKTNLAYG